MESAESFVDVIRPPKSPATALNVFKKSDEFSPSSLAARFPTGTKTGTREFRKSENRIECLILLVGGVGFEPTTLGL